MNGKCRKARCIKRTKSVRNKIHVEPEWLPSLPRCWSYRVVALHGAACCVLSARTQHSHSFRMKWTEFIASCTLFMYMKPTNSNILFSPPKVVYTGSDRCECVACIVRKFFRLTRIETSGEKKNIRRDENATTKEKIYRIYSNYNVRCISVALEAFYVAHCRLSFHIEFPPFPSPSAASSLRFYFVYMLIFIIIIILFFRISI